MVSTCSQFCCHTNENSCIKLGHCFSDQDNIMICCIFLSSMATHQLLIPIYSTVTLLIAAASPWKWSWHCLLSSGYIPTVYIWRAETTKPITWTRFMVLKERWKPSSVRPCSRWVSGNLGGILQVFLGNWPYHCYSLLYSCFRKPSTLCLWRTSLRTRFSLFMVVYFPRMMSL